MTRIQIGLYRSPSGGMLEDLTPFLEDVEIASNRYGFGTLTGFWSASLFESFRLLDQPLLHVEATAAGQPVWQGRLARPKLLGRGLGIKALGYWSALGDAEYTALWSNTRVSDWRPIIETESSTSKPQLYITDKQNRLQVNLKKNGVYASGDDAFTLACELPDASSQQAKRLEVSYNYNLPSNWTVQGIAWAAGFTSGVTNNITTTGGAATGTLTWDLSATPKVIIGLRIFNSSGAAYTNTSEDDAFYARFTSPRVTASGASLYADEIARALVAYANGINPSQLQNSSALIQSPALDLRDEIYEDQTPMEILIRLAGLGDSQTPPRQWDVAVWDDRMLQLVPRGWRAQTWYVDISELEFERALEQLWNSVYAVYQEAGGRALRTAVATDALSPSLYGITRRKSLGVRTTSATQAGVHRDAFLADHKDPIPKVGIRFRYLYDQAGALWPGWAARPGDTVVIRNLPEIIGPTIDRVGTFRIDESTYYPVKDELNLVPESPAALLDFMVARRAAGVG